MSQVAEIKEKLDIVEIVGERVKLQRSGKNFRGLCPFHSEKSPSFFVSPDLQSFTCFGCHKKGDIYTFLQEYDRLTFRESLEVLAEKAGIVLEQSGGLDAREQERKQVLTLNELAAKYYNYLLVSHKLGEPGRTYLKQRAIQNGTRDAFQLGYAPKGWTNLLHFLTQKGFSERDIEQAGLCVRGKTGRLYDRFRERLIFPLFDHRGRVVGFSGRVLDSTAKEAKYINTPETELYHKRQHVFGLWQNFTAIKEKDAVLIVEGEFDVLSSVQAHVKNVVAIKGSALTTDHIRLLSRSAQTLILALDADEAGIKATSQAIPLVQPFPVTLRVLPLSGGKDPDELAKTDPGAWREHTKLHTSAFTYLLEHTLAKHDITTAEGQKAVTTTLLTVLLTVENAVERAFYQKQLAQKLNISEGVLEDEWQRLRRKQQVGSSSQRTHEATPAESESSESAVPEDVRGRYLLQLFLQQDALPPLTPLPEPRWLDEPILQRLLQAYLEHIREHQSFTLREFAAQLPEELKEIVSMFTLETLSVAASDWNREVSLMLVQLQQRWKQRRRTQIADDLRALESRLDTDPSARSEYERLQAEFLTV